MMGDPVGIYPLFYSVSILEVQSEELVRSQEAGIRMGAGAADSYQVSGSGCFWYLNYI